MILSPNLFLSIFLNDQETLPVKQIVVMIDIIRYTINKTCDMF